MQAEAEQRIEQEVTAILAALKDQPGALLPILHRIQDEFGYIPPQTVPAIAAALNQTRAEIHGVISFYHHFRTSPPGRQVMQICRAEACQAVGARALERHAKQQLGIDYQQTTRDQAFSLEPVYCLGNCARGPSLRIGDEIFGRVTPARFDELVAELGAAPLQLN